MGWSGAREWECDSGWVSSEKCFLFCGNLAAKIASLLVLSFDL